MGQLGSTWFNLGQPESTWVNLSQLGLTQVNLGQLGLTWANFGQPGSKGPFMVQIGPYQDLWKLELGPETDKFRSKWSV